MKVEVLHGGYALQRKMLLKGYESILANNSCSSSDRQEEVEKPSKKAIVSGQSKANYSSHDTNDMTTRKNAILALYSAGNSATSIKAKPSLQSSKRQEGGVHTTLAIHVVHVSSNRRFCTLKNDKIIEWGLHQCTW